jgi:hypothetical protein
MGGRRQNIHGMYKGSISVERRDDSRPHVRWTHHLWEAAAIAEWRPFGTTTFLLSFFISWNPSRNTLATDGLGVLRSSVSAIANNGTGKQGRRRLIRIDDENSTCEFSLRLDVILRERKLKRGSKIQMGPWTCCEEVQDWSRAHRMAAALW